MISPVDRLRLEKAAADCGFEMTPQQRDDAVEMRSARFPEVISVSITGPKSFKIGASDPAVLDAEVGAKVLAASGFGELYAVLRAIAARARTRPNRVADAFKKKTAVLPKSTEAERLVVQRVGQQLFRDSLLDYWQGRCCVTGLDVPALLRASHIRPWASCDTDEQRLDVFNGLLLAPHLDALFDSGLMTVADSGEVWISSALSVSQREQLGLPEAMRVAKLREEHVKYLEFHRACVWIDNSNAV